MAYKRDLTADDQIFYDADRVLRYAVYQGNPTAAEVAAGTAIPENVAGWECSWTLRRTVDGAVLIQKTTGSGITISGTYNASALLNTQRIEVFLEDTDTYTAGAQPEDPPVVDIAPGNYVYALKRLDAGAETPLAYGKLKLLKTAGWE